MEKPTEKIEEQKKRGARMNETWPNARIHELKGPYSEQVGHSMNSFSNNLSKRQSHFKTKRNLFENPYRKPKMQVHTLAALALIVLLTLKKSKK